MRCLSRGISEASAASNARDARRHHLQLGKVIRPKLYGTFVESELAKEWYSC